MSFKPILLIIAFFVAESAISAEPWDWEVTPYLWAAGIDGGVSAGSIDADISADFDDIVNVLQGGALLRLDGMSGRNGVFGDIVFLALEEDEAKDTLGGTLEADLDSLIIEGGYRRKVSESLALDFGIRYWEFDTKLTPPLLPVVRRSTDWTDGFIGVRFSSALGNDWDWVLRGNVGSGGSDLALGLELDFRREFASGNRFTAGLRVLDIDYDDSSGSVPIDISVSFSGLTIGYTFNL